MTVKSSYRKIRDERDSLASDVKILTGRIESKDHTITQRGDQLKQLRDAFDTLVIEQEALQATNGKLSSQNISLRDSYSDTSKQLAQCQNNNAELTEKMKKLSADALHDEIFNKGVIEGLKIAFEEQTKNLLRHGMVVTLREDHS